MNTETKQLTPQQKRFQALLEKVKAKQAQKEALLSEQETGINNAAIKAPLETNAETSNNKTFIHRGKEIIYNDKQQLFIDTVLDIVEGRNTAPGIVLLGAAGTGKTTCLLGTVEALCNSSYVPTINTAGHKYIHVGTPGILALSYTRRSVMNDKKAMPDNLKQNCITIHKALEYEPHYYEVEAVDEDGETYIKKTMRFEPSRGSFNPLPSEVKVIFINEASMVSTDLFAEVQSAQGCKVIFIFTGDIQQLPPVFGSAILGYKILELPTIELTEVYRQALDSPIIRLAHRILSGNPLKFTEFSKYEEDGKLLFYTWKKKFNFEIATAMASKLITIKPHEAEKVTTVPRNILDAFMQYNPEEDMILCPFNKSFGTIELNKHIAQDLASKNTRQIYEIIAGYERHYYSIGDRVLCDKEDGIIIDILRNPEYLGKSPQSPSLTLDYWGIEHSNKTSTDDNGEAIFGEADIDRMLEVAISDDDRVNKASHVITVKLLDTEREVILDTAAEINQLALGYAMTVHKAQGSEYRKIYLFLHQSHATMLQRELLYTAVTRAREELVIICEEDTFVKGIINQRIKGNTLAEKAEYFKGKLENEE